MTEDRKKQNLVVRVENGQLVIRIGVETLAFAADNSDLFNPFNEDKNDWVRKFKVINDLEWADDIARELAREDEVGGSPIIYLLDKMFEKALYQGSLGVWDSEG